MTASACSKMALDTSVTSARVGVGWVIMDSSMCVATMQPAPQPVAVADDAALDDGQFLDADFSAQVAAATR